MPFYSNPGNYTYDVSCFQDSGSSVGATCDVGTSPSVALSGSSLTLYLPFTVCTGVGPCVANPNMGFLPYTTGVVVGTFSAVPAPTGGTSAAYQFSLLCLYVDGVQLDCVAPVAAGATTTGQLPTLFLAGLQSSNATVAVTTAREGTLYIPGLPAIPLTTPGVCVQQSPTAPPCP